MSALSIHVFIIYYENFGNNKCGSRPNICKSLCIFYSNMVAFGQASHDDAKELQSPHIWQIMQAFEASHQRSGSINSRIQRVKTGSKFYQIHRLDMQNIRYQRLAEYVSYTRIILQFLNDRNKIPCAKRARDAKKLRQKTFYCACASV